MTRASSTFADLLHLAGLTGAWTWDRVTLINNVGPIVPSRQVAGDFPWNRGCNLVLYDPEGHPEYFCKCRPAHHTGFAREMRIVEALGQVPALEGAIPRTTTGGDERVMIQASAYLQGTPLSLRTPGMGLDEWAAALAEVMALVRRVAAAAVEVLPDLCPAGGSITVGEAIEPALSYLGPVVESQEVIEGLRTAARRVGTVRGQPQHADLWPGNVLQRRGGWSILDFEQFGTISVPLYDVFHLLRTSWDLRRPCAPGASGRPWLERMRLEPLPAGRTYDLVRREAELADVRSDQLTGLLAYYVADIAHRSHRRGYYYDRLVAEVIWLGRTLAHDEDPFTNRGQ